YRCLPSRCLDRSGPRGFVKAASSATHLRPYSIFRKRTTINHERHGRQHQPAAAGSPEGHPGIAVAVRHHVHLVPPPSVDPWGESSARGGFSPEPGLSLGRHRGCDLNLQPKPALERVDGLRVIIEGESMADHRLAVNDPPHHECQCPLEAIEHRHRPDDPDLVSINVEGRKLHAGLAAGHPEDEEGPTRSDATEPILDRGHRAGGVDYDVPALRTLELVRR